ncbi:uncharacterized protein LOC125479469 isoform X2 [Pyrus x bretschneideri]|uniref:uncharacterized protein LOC125479469 isoform X2 n=1 Tax=Pyrus x bretschneideri TaxID=225117 RepID=UPI00202E09B5|nr:uncharacterized protein LOC125479469 isoform X2 [Pyrus x bretschneideri]
MGNGNQNQKEDPNRLRVEFPNGAIASGTPTMLGRLINRVAETNPKEVGKTRSSASKGLWNSIPSTSGGSTKIKATSAATSKENTDGMVNQIQKGAINMAQNVQKGAVEMAQNAPKKAVEMAQNAPKKASELKEKLRRKFFPKPWEKPEYQALYFARQNVPKKDAPRIDPEVFIGKKKNW